MTTSPSPDAIAAAAETIVYVVTMVVAFWSAVLGRP
jgi:hypothetical protein